MNHYLESNCLRFIDFVDQIEPALRKGESLVLEEILKKVRMNITKLYYDNNREKVDKLLLIIKESTKDLPEEVQISIQHTIGEIYHKVNPEEEMKDTNTSIFSKLPKVKVGTNITDLMKKAQEAL